MKGGSALAPDLARHNMTDDAAEPTADQTDKNIERERIRKLSSSSQGHLCPRCSKAALVRVRRPFYLRLVRRVGIDLRMYRCAMCGYSTMIRNRP